MTNGIIKPESAISLFDVDARAFGVVANSESGRIVNQKISATRYYTQDGTKYRIRAELRFDDECGNGHESFSITGDIDENYCGKWREHSGGCIHEDIAQRFPEFTHLIKWHLTSTDGPMHYIGNTVYHAGDRDCNGKANGETLSFEHFAYFGNSSVGHKLGGKFLQFLKSRMYDNGKGWYVLRENGYTDFNVISIAHENTAGITYKFGPKYTLAGFGERWHECPFDSAIEAEEFCTALNTCSVVFKSNAVTFSDGKARDLDAARCCAVWHDATDAQLSLPRAELEVLLNARLPALLAEFKADMLACGFSWPLTIETLKTQYRAWKCDDGTYDFIDNSDNEIAFQNFGNGRDEDSAWIELLKTTNLTRRI